MKNSYGVILYMKKFMSKRLCAVIVLIALLTAFMCPFTVSAEGKVKVYFDPNGGVCETEYVETDDAGKLEILPAADRSGYIFGGWYTDATDGVYVFAKGVDAESDSATVFDEDTTLFAHWTKMESPVIKSPEKDQTIKANVGESLEFSVDVDFAEEITWFLNKNDGSDIIKLDEDFFTTVTIDEVTEEYESYVYYCEIRNSTMAEDEPSVLSPAFTIDVNGVDKDYDLPEPEAVSNTEGLSDTAVILIAIGAVVVMALVAAVISTAVSSAAEKKNKEKNGRNRK